MTEDAYKIRSGIRGWQDRCEVRQDRISLFGKARTFDKRIDKRESVAYKDKSEDDKNQE